MFKELSDISMTAMITGYHRFLEQQSDDPLVVDLYIKQLLDPQIIKSSSFTFKNRDYTIVRNKFIDDYLRYWIEKFHNSQIIILGAGLDTRAYRMESLSKGRHHVFEIDLPSIIEYKQSKLSQFTPQCTFTSISADLTTTNWVDRLEENQFNPEQPTLWIIEGLLYYITKEQTQQILTSINELSQGERKIVADLCIEAVAQLDFGYFMKYFKWGIEIDKVNQFFQLTGWNIHVAFADKYAHGRDVGQQIMMFVFSQMDDIIFGD